MSTLSTRAKEELASLSPKNKYEALAEFSALVQTAGSVNLSGHGMTVEVVTDNAALSSLASGLALTLMLRPPEVTFGKHITLTFEEGRELLVKLKVFTPDMTRINGIDEGLLRSGAEKRCYVRGAFLGAGFLSTGKNNHMEFAFSGEKLRDDLIELLPPSAAPVGMGERGGRPTAYLKSKEKISDVLVFMGATKAALELQEEMLVSSIGRRAAAAQNCDVANIDRAIGAAAKQIAAIDAIDRSIGIESLDERLRTTALLRKGYPEANISELAEMLGVSKSCAAHRLDKLLAAAKKLDK